VWNKVVAQNPRHKNIQLAALGRPVTVSKQVVAGIKYKFKFSDGSTVQVFHQPWTDTLEVTDANFSPSVKARSERDSLRSAASKRPVGNLASSLVGGWLIVAWLTL